LSSGKFEWASTSADDDRWTLFISGGAKRDNMLHRMHACCSVPRRTNKEEEAYLHLMATLMVAGEPREGRNGVTRSLQVPQQLLYFADISRRFPLLTTKKVFWRGVVEELIFFLKGRTDCKALAEKRVYIWEKNTSREFLDEHGLSHYPEGIAGPFYGFQWRRFGAIYDPAHPDIDYYNDQPHADQVVNLVNHIKRDPTSRRLFMSAWNPRDLDQMVLPPCHVSYQFFVTDEQKLSCILYMRSSDVFLGLPFNIASASLLTMLIASWSGLRGAASLSVVIGDAHLYENHVSAALTQLNRTPRMFPRVTLRDPAESIGEAGGQGQPTVDSRINALSVDHFILTEYDPYDTIAASMSA
jgi:thymidylate synthase